MNSRALVGIGALIACWSCTGPPPAVDRVVLVTIDTLRWDHLGYMGFDVATPNLDRLANSGMVFTQAITAAPLTLPSHASMLSGLYPTAHGTRNNGTFRLRDEVETVAERLRTAGFATGAFVGAFVLDSRFGLEQGFDRYDDELPEENPIHFAYFPERRAEDVIARALEWVKERGDGRFFLWVHLFDPHAPYAPPSPFRERYLDRPYVGEVAYADFALGKLFDGLKAIDNGESTAIVVSADHGEGLGQHGESTHSIFVYDATVRVPLILSAPQTPGPHRIASQVRTVDIAPTLLELAGLEAPRDIDGVSLLRYGSGKEPPAAAAYGETFAPRFSFNWSELRFLRRNGYKLIDAPRPELYDLKADPGETHNLWTEASPPREARELLAELETLKQADRLELSPTVELDEESRRRLESLGYVGTTASSSREERDRPDPKDHIEIQEKLQTLLGADLSRDERIAGYREVLELEPANVLARTRLANTLAEEKQFEEAISEYRKLLETSELDATALKNLASALLLVDRVDEAVAATARALTRYPWDPDAQVLRGEALERAGRSEEALEAYSRAIALAPEDAENHWRRGTVALNRGDALRAESDFREALSLNEAFEPAQSALARLLSREGRSEEARSLLAQAGPNPESADMKAALAEVLLADGGFDRARSLLEQALSQEPDNTRVLALLGPVYGRARELDKAAAVLERALALGEQDAELRRNLALVYSGQGKVGKALSQLQLASEQSPESDAVWFSLGNVYLSTKDLDRAIAAFERALTLRPGWPGASFNLALAYEGAGRRDEAASTFRDFLEGEGASDARRRAEAEQHLVDLAGHGRNR